MNSTQPAPRPIPRPPLSLVGLAAAVLVVVVLRVSGALQASEDALVIMGFDPDRARLLTALIAGGVAAVVVAGIGGRTWVAVVASIGATAAMFGPVFITETKGALAATGAEGAFDPVGWAVSLATVVVAAVIIGWAAATLAHAVRTFLMTAGGDARAAARSRPLRLAGFARAGIAVVVLAALGATLPVFSDMVNFAPDVHMRQGPPLRGGLLGVNGATQGGSTGGGAPAPNSSAGASSSPAVELTDPGALPAGLAAGPLPGSLVSPGILATTRPWTSSIPSGSGSISRVTLPGPWIGGDSPVAVADIYLPPGYGTGPTKYPVLYEVPYAAESWQKGTDMAAMLDSLITSGQIPPMIVVFASTAGGPYRDSECADSFDRRETFDTYMATTLVQYLDSHYHTVEDPAARALFGASQGGYCAAALWSHHPDVFATAVSFSGYFVSGVSSPETLNAARPFGGDAAYEARTSPITVAAQLPAKVAARTFVVLSADLNNPFFGPEARAYAQVLAVAGVPLAILPSPLGHSWQTQRDQLPTVLQMIGARMALLGVFG